MSTREVTREVSEPVRTVLQACAEGRIGPNLLLMQLFLWAETPELARGVLEDALSAAVPADQRCNLIAALRLWESTPGAYHTVKAVQATEQAGKGTAGWASAFDRAAVLSPEASVALYSLGRADILDAATTEVVDLLRSWRLLGPDRAVLEIGCGIGRFLRALASEMGCVVGLDISPHMVAEARRRCAGLGNVTVVQGERQGLGIFADGRFDVVLAVDSFPYVVDAGSDLARAHVTEAARVLRPGGSLVIFNYSYRGDDGRDRAELEALGRENGFGLNVAGERLLRLWDGAAYWLQRSGGEERQPPRGR
ncbi:class I SAM-dependent methyltransferase [Rhodoligotrophos defluvii]|uniref:class I SAM-dependent methyltransferase n=1 Tax=Rhodoligotrophos defluvii TaxID=2561934 RepID=UPI0010C939BA|nr:methyltransferase domain-containing protein [Rhodoligotrophos defluvii]